jgi:bifunctional non-homologous end joining protein LigD
MEIRKDKREGRIFVDILRNEHAQTAVAPYSLRARDGAPVATPLNWSELTKTLHPRKYTIRNIFRRLSMKGDPWKEIRKSSARVKITD